MHFKNYASHFIRICVKHATINFLIAFIKNATTRTETNNSFSPYKLGLGWRRDGVTLS